MTFGGFLLLVLQYAVLSFYDPVYDAVKQDSSIVVIPTWVWWFSLFAQFFSHTLGKKLITFCELFTILEFLFVIFVVVMC